MSDRTRSFVKVQDGCDYNCSFCTIPDGEGKELGPDTIAATVRQVRKIAEGGQVREVVLTGVNLGDFGKSRVSGEMVGMPSDTVTKQEWTESRCSTRRSRKIFSD